MQNHRYILEPYKGASTRYTCPSCGKQREFARYIDTETGEHLAEHVGKCNRESNCGYHYKPKEYFSDTKNHQNNPQPPHKTPQENPTPMSFFTHEQSLKYFDTSLQHYEQNHFALFLIKSFGETVANEAIEKYHLGTSKYWNGATIFWQIDKEANLRTGKIMLYNPDTGKRYKDKFHWAHSVLKFPDYHLQQCFFGEYLILFKENREMPVAIVESEKTAMIASIYFPQCVWLACGGIAGLSAEKCKILKGRNVTFYPDVKGFDKWRIRAGELNHITNFQVSDLLEKNANEQERNEGADLADYLLKFKL